MVLLKIPVPPNEIDLTASVLQACAAPGVLETLQLDANLELTSQANIEAIIGFTSDLRIQGGMLCGDSGNPLPVRACQGFLFRLGAGSGEPGNVGECLSVCRQMGIHQSCSPGLWAAMFEVLQTRGKSLARCICILEQRGYRIRLAHRLTSVCQGIPDAVAEPVPTDECSPRRLFASRILPMDLLMAA